MRSRRAAAVIGAAGFLGSALVTRLRTLGVGTTCFTRSNPSIGDDGVLDGALASASTVFWLASSIRPATASDHAEQIAADHDALQALLNRLLEVGHEFRVIAVSSGGTVYDSSHPAPHSEVAPIAPANAYGEAMYQIEKLIRAAPQSTVLRVANAYGPGQPARRGQGVVAHWLSGIVAGEPVHLIGSADVARDYVFIDDVVDAMARAHLADALPATVNVGSGHPTTLRELLDEVRAVVAPRDVKLVHDAARGFDAPSTWLDVRLAAQTLGWRPTTTLRDGLEATWRHVLATSTPPDRTEGRLS